MKFMTEGPIVPMVLEAENAIEKLRKLMGATDPAKADAGTIRKQFATNIERNAIHGSDGPETAAYRDRVLFSVSLKSCLMERLIGSLMSWSNSADAHDHGRGHRSAGTVSDILGRGFRFVLAGCRWTSDIQRDNFSFYFPLGTSIVVSIVLTIRVRVC